MDDQPTSLRKTQTSADQVDAEAIAAGLSEAQKRALASAPSTPLGNIWLVCHGSTKRSLVIRRLAEGYGDWCTLTSRGKEVRDVLMKEKG